MFSEVMLVEVAALLSSAKRSCYDKFGNITIR